MIWLKSALYREEILKWSLYFALIAWAITATAYAVSKRQEVILVGFDQNGARIISEEKDRLLQGEAVLFIQAFLQGYLNFDAGTFQSQMGKAADFFSEEVWQQEQPKLLKIGARLKTDPLSQSGEILAIDKVGGGTYEIQVLIRVNRRAQVTQAKASVVVELKKRVRTTSNPWLFEISRIEERLQ